MRRPRRLRRIRRTVELAGDRKRAADQALDVAQLAALLAAHQGDRRARRAVAAGPAYAVHVVLGIVRQFVVDDMRDVRHVDAARGNIGGNEDARPARGKRLEGGLTGILALVAVDGRRLVPVDGEVLRDAIGAVLGTREDDDPLERRIGEERVELVALLLGVGEDHLLVDGDDGGCRRRRLDADRLVQQRRRELGDLVRHGGGEHRGLAARTDGGGNRLHRADEAHVEHAVGLVEHQPAGLVEAQLAIIDEILEPAGRGDDDIDAAGDLGHLRRPRNAAQHQHGAEPGAIGEHAQHFVDLNGELTGRREDQRAGRHRRGTALELGEPGKDRQAEGRGLARARLGNAHDVPAFQLRPDGLCLDRRGGVEAGLGERADKLRGKAEFGEGFGHWISCTGRAPANKALRHARGTRGRFISARRQGLPRLRFHSDELVRGTSPLTALADKKRSPSP